MIVSIIQITNKNSLVLQIIHQITLLHHVNFRLNESKIMDVLLDTLYFLDVYLLTNITKKTNTSTPYLHIFMIDTTLALLYNYS